MKKKNLMPIVCLAASALALIACSSPSEKPAESSTPSSESQTPVAIDYSQWTYDQFKVKDLDWWNEKTISYQITTSTGTQEAWKNAGVFPAIVNFYADGSAVEWVVSKIAGADAPCGIEEGYEEYKCVYVAFGAWKETSASVDGKVTLLWDEEPVSSDISFAPDATNTTFVQYLSGVSLTVSYDISKTPTYKTLQEFSAAKLA